MKKFHTPVLGLAAGAAIAFAATSADANGRRSIRDWPAASKWTGCYVGLQGGFAWGNVDGVGANAAGFFPGHYSYDANGFVGGVHAGCAYQTGQWVLGIEGDTELSSVDGSGNFLNTNDTAYVHTTDLNWLGSVRGRVGFTTGPTLFYLTGGWAFAETDHTVAFAATPNTPFHTYSAVRNGWTLGGGAEMFIASGLTARIEYRFTDLGDLSNVGGVNSSDKNELEMHTVRLGVSARF